MNSLCPSLEQSLGDLGALKPSVTWETHMPLALKSSQRPRLLEKMGLENLLLVVSHWNSGANMEYSATDFWRGEAVTSQSRAFQLSVFE